MRPIILMYHSISEDDCGDPYTVTPASFEEQINWLIKNKFEFVSLHEIVSVINQRQLFLKKRYVTLSFDDGYSDFMYNALPILRKHGIPSTLFIVTNKLGCKDDWSSSGAKRRLLTKDEIMHIKSFGDVTIGSHTLNHVDLTALDHPSLQNELIGSRKSLTEFGESFYSFSYPWGKYIEREKRAVREAGYDCAVSTDSYSKIGKKDIYNLGRLTMTCDFDFKKFENIYL